jgi:hypothetical protein
VSTDQQLPPPLTPAESNLRDFAFMPLDVARLRDSNLAAKAKGDEFRCAVMLWCAAWHQTPAGSLPDDDQTLAGFAGFGRVVREWMKVKAGAMRGWIKCSDGRFYHPVVAEKVNEAWAGRVEYQEKREGDRLRKQEERRQKKQRDEAEKSKGSPPDSRDMSAGQRQNGAGNPAEKPLTVDSGQWTVDSGQVPGRSASTQPELRATNPADDPAVPEPVPAALISKAMRAHGIMANPGDPRLATLATQGVSAETVDAACVEAKAAKPNERINPGYVIAILERWAVAALKVKANGAVAPGGRGGPSSAKFSPAAYVNLGRTDNVVEVAP